MPTSDDPDDPLSRSCSQFSKVSVGSAISQHSQGDLTGEHTNFTITNHVAKRFSEDELAVSVMAPAPWAYTSHFLFDEEPNPDTLTAAQLSATAWLHLFQTSTQDPQSKTSIFANKNLPTFLQSGFFDAGGFLSVLYDNITVEGKKNIELKILLTVFPGQMTKSQLKLESYDTIIKFSEDVRQGSPAEVDHALERLSKVSIDFFQSLLVPYIQLGNRTPHPSNISTPLDVLSSDTFQANAGRKSSLREKVLARDGRRCLISKEREIDDQKHMSYEDQLKEVDFGKLEAAHIMPHCMNEPDSISGDLSPAKRNFWALANMLSPGISALAHSERIDLPDNAILLAQKYHVKFARLHFWFTEVESSPARQVYKVETVPNQFVFPKNIQTASIVEFSSRGEHLTPNPCYLAFHRALAKAAHAAGAAAKTIPILDREDESGVLAADGSEAQLLHNRLAGFSLIEAC